MKKIGYFFELIPYYFGSFFNRVLYGFKLLNYIIFEVSIFRFFIYKNRIVKNYLTIYLFFFQTNCLNI